MTDASTPGRTFRWIAFALSCLLIIFSLPPLAGAAETVSPVTAEPTNQRRTGKVIWVDLVTGDVRRAADFYRQVFGWAVRVSLDGGFAEASYEGRPVAAIARSGKEAPVGEAQWIISISVPDVDMAAASVRRHGGQVLEKPDNLLDRGRYALVSDSRGALFMLLRASGGDPLDEAAVPNEWLWAELWTDEPEAAAEFYQSVLGYKTVAMKEKDGGDLLVMGRDGVARATVVKLPWDEVKPNWLVYLLVENLTATLLAVERNGGDIVIPPTAAADGNVAIVADPTGGVFAVQQRGGKP